LLVAVRVDREPPLDVDKDDHEANEAEEDEEAGENVEDESLPVASVDTVESIEEDTKVQVEIGDDNG